MVIYNCKTIALRHNVNYLRPRRWIILQDMGPPYFAAFIIFSPSVYFVNVNLRFKQHKETIAQHKKKRGECLKYIFS